ncbi:MAG: class I SAM-dependent methyltransferase, partial [Phycisphaerales bacterium]|nr:class I SAM-dependent methyltransferase [Phycisphaerales bacterium]
EHVADWRSAFANMAALLKPGGKVLLTAPFFYPLHEEPYDFWRPTRHTIAAHAAGAGLEVEEFVGLGDAWHVMGTLLGAVAFEPRRPGIAGRLWTLGCRVSRSVALRLIKSGVLPGSVAMPSKLYLSNGAVLRKPRGPEGAA